MRFKRDFEQKKALVNKWFTADELKEYSNLSQKPILAKVHNHSSSSLAAVIGSCLPEIADEKENIMEAITEFVSTTFDSESMLTLLDMFQDNLFDSLTEDGAVNDIELSEKQVREILNRTFAIVELIKTLTEIITSYDRVKFFERRIELAKAGVSE